MTVPVLPPVRSLPAEFRGRQDQLDELLTMAGHSEGRVVVLTGMGGIGKSTVAAAVAEQVRRRGIRRHVWWVSVAEPGSLVAGMLTIARTLGASTAELNAIASGAPQAPDALWAVLERTRHRWLLVIDNADTPQDLALPGAPAGPQGESTHDTSAARVADGRGWLRKPRSGMVVVTTRYADAATWGRDATIRRIDRLGAADAGRILRDLAPEGGDQREAESLGERLGGLPLALHLAGRYLGSDFALTRGFAEYQRSLDTSSRSVDLLTPDRDLNLPDRATVLRTWETSLDALDLAGVPQARTLLRLLGCLGSATALPDDLLDPELLRTLAPPDAVTATDRIGWLEQGMRALIRLGLVDRTPAAPDGEPTGHLMLHPVVADVARVHLDTERRAGEVSAVATPSVAVALIAGALDRLATDRPADWPRFRLLAPHFRALLNTVAPTLDGEALALLARCGTTLTDYCEWSGPASLGVEVATATLAAVRSLPEDHRDVLEVRYWLARCRVFQDDRVAAERELGQLHADQVAALGAAAPEALRTECVRAAVLIGLGRYEEADELLRAVLAAQREVLGERHLDTLATYHELGRVEGHRRRWPEAEAMFRTAATGRAAVFGTDHPAALASRNRVGWTIGEQGRTEEAEAELSRVLAVRRSLFGDEHHDTLATVERLAWVRALNGRLDEAERDLASVVGIRTRLMGPSYLGTLNSTVLLARVIARQGRRDEARSLLLDVHERQQRLLGSGHPETERTRALIEQPGRAGPAG
ncbi:tetratricopeptide repeat protein [Kitasatospora albolonga]|uniref:tetratricopeptide repeat protein n=1 Tax=Kitasatospora albolonga TaxID=68173 RepID=UPI0031E79119